MEGYGQFCPVAKAAEVLCTRWTILIVRELMVGSSRFNELRRGVPTCSTALLSKRLKELEAVGVVAREQAPSGVSYRLTKAGQELFPLIQGLGEWGQRWVRTDYEVHDLDPGLLLWDVRRNLEPGGMGPGTTTIAFVFPSVSARRRFFWLVDNAQEIDLCLTDPGRTVDLMVTADLAALTRVWLGDIRFGNTLRDGTIRLEGQRRLTQRFGGWFGQHPVFASVRPGTDGNRSRVRSPAGQRSS
jgi:DNA-binding HxlR family transcriptional regulator